LETTYDETLEETRERLFKEMKKAEEEYVKAKEALSTNFEEVYLEAIRDYEKSKRNV